MKTLTLAALIALASATAACSFVASAPAEKPAAPAEPAPAPPAPEPVNLEQDVMFELGLTEYARMRLGELGEKVTISGMYYGEPNADAKAAMTAADGPVFVVGTYDVTVDPVDQTVTVAGAGIDAARQAQLAGPLKLNVNVFTARTKHPDNLITCTLIDDEVAELRAKPPATLCEMLDAN